MRRLWLASALVAALAMADIARGGLTVPPNAPGQYAPKDECGAVPDAAQFRNMLADAVYRRDAAAIVALASPDIELDYGGGAGREELRRRLSSKRAELWLALDDLMRLGCAVHDGTLILPWFFDQDMGDADPYDVWLVKGAAVPLLERPDAGGRAVRSLSWQIVSVAGNDPDAPLQQVRVIGGADTGYVETASLRSLIDYRLLAERSGDGWRITAFIAGD